MMACGIESASPQQLVAALSLGVSVACLVAVVRRLMSLSEHNLPQLFAAKLQRGMGARAVSMLQQAHHSKEVLDLVTVLEASYY
jgi:hypothetical protein